MNRSYYNLDEAFDRPQNRRHRDRFSEFLSTGTTHTSPSAQAPYAAGAIPALSKSQPRLTNGALPVDFPRESGMALQVPVDRFRPRSVPPPMHAVARHRQRSRSSSRSSGSSGGHSPISKARHAVKDTFTHSNEGLGAGLLGAVVGGLLAREVSDAAIKSRHNKAHEGGRRSRHESAKDRQRSKVIATLAGAVVGGLGANAVEKRLEMAKGRDRKEQEDWEKKWGKESDLPHYDTGKEKDKDHGWGRRWDDYDFVYDERRPRRRRSEENYRYR